MALRLILVGVVAGLGLNLPARESVQAWKHSAETWVYSCLAEWDARMPTDEKAFVVVAEPTAAPAEIPAPLPTPAPVAAATLVASLPLTKKPKLAAAASTCQISRWRLKSRSSHRPNQLSHRPSRSSFRPSPS